MGLIRNINDGGVARSIFRVSNDKEAAAYQSLIDMDMPTCPKCNSPMKLKPEDMIFEVTNPLSQMLGMDLATFKPTCPNCREELTLNDEIDLNPAFPTAVTILRRARDNYQALKAKHNKGGTNGQR